MTVLTARHEGVQQITVDNFGVGTITVEPGPPDAVELAVDSGDPDYLEEISARLDRDQLRLSFPTRLNRSSAANLRLAVPPGLGFTIRAGSADIAISADIGESKIVNGSGDVTLASAVDLECSTASGQISTGRLDGRAARISTGSGDITVAQATCAISAKSGSGDIVLRRLHGALLQANSGSGDIAVKATSGSVDLRSASGSLSVGIADLLPAWLDLGSVSGDVSIYLDSTSPPEQGSPYVAIRARTASGDISIYRA